jgi:flagellum-specific peptidoglycan hydrolase FlgJ
MFGYFLSKKDFSFQISLGKAEPIVAERVDERPDVIEASAMPFVSSSAPKKKKAPKSEEVEVGNLANEATAVGAGVSKKEKEKAAAVSNLSVVFSKRFAQKYGQKEADERLAQCRGYIQRYAALARIESRRSGVPASITLAQGLLESNAGESRLAKNAQNHFGIKCFSKTCKPGHCMNATDDSHKDFFVKFPDAAASFKAHSEFLQKKRYAKLRNIHKIQYKAWAKGLKQAGYATDPNYDQKLVTIIEYFKLYQFDF